MYSYQFQFFKPGKENYPQKEIFMLLTALQEINHFEIKFPPRDPHIDQKQGMIGIQPVEKELGLSLRLPGKDLGLFLGPAEGKFGEIALLSMPVEQFDENPRENAPILFRAALTVSKVLEPYFAWGDHEAELDKLSHCLRFDELGALAWANLFSREFLNEIGGIDQVLLNPEDTEDKKGVAELLDIYSVAPLELSPSPAEETKAAIILGIERRHPGVLFRSFEIPSEKAIEFE